MAEPVTASLIGATVLSATGAATAGVAANNMAKSKAEQSEIAGREAVAASQRQAIQVRRQGNLVQSRAQAVAASSGAGASDPTVLDIMGGIGAQTEYNALSALYVGQSEARNRQAEANAARFEGKQAMVKGFMDAGASVLSGGASLYDKYMAGRMPPESVEITPKVFGSKPNSRLLSQAVYR